MGLLDWVIACCFFCLVVAIVALVYCNNNLQVKLAKLQQKLGLLKLVLLARKKCEEFLAGKSGVIGEFYLEAERLLEDIIEVIGEQNGLDKVIGDLDFKIRRPPSEVIYDENWPDLIKSLKDVVQFHNKEAAE